MEEPFMLHRSLEEVPHTVTRAEGNFLYLQDGSCILDACGGAAVAIIGHGNVEVIEATVTQMRKVSYIHTAAYTTDSAEELAKCILQAFSVGQPSDETTLCKAFFLGSGSEANDAAMKCARQYWYEKGETQRKFYIARKQSYHGNTIGAMSVSSVLGRKVSYDEILLPNVSFVNAADAFHRQSKQETDEEYAGKLARELEDEIIRLGPTNIISVM
jgi:adenosylmethionine-8-amino-7-oxononanoate aminotransferase